MNDKYRYFTIYSELSRTGDYIKCTSIWYSLGVENIYKLFYISKKKLIYIPESIYFTSSI